MKGLSDMQLTSRELEIKQAILNKLTTEFGRNLENADSQMIYKACALTVRDKMLADMAASNARQEEKNPKKLYYMSFEFLMGRSLSNNILNMMELEEYRHVMADLGVDFDKIFDCEHDAGLGNGGLGRLAACFLDSLTTLELPAVGCSIRYEYGLFQQQIIDGFQVEAPDWWLEHGNVWEVKRPEEQLEVKFEGKVETFWNNGKLSVRYHDYTSVIAMPYDFPVNGFGAKQMNYLRLWEAVSPKRLDMKQFNQGDYTGAVQQKELVEVISKVLYPEDNHSQGKLLRLKQQYFLASATIQWILKEYEKNNGTDWSKLPEKVVIHINDTHPTLAIPEMMRILMDEKGLGWDEAWSIVTHTFAYTNHTVMSEALEKWPIHLFEPLLPRIYMIVREINFRLMEKLARVFPSDRQKHDYMAIIANNQINMANLCLASCFAVNGVSSLHTRILTNDIFRDYYSMNPDKFHSFTNGITFRRWIHNANPALSALISEKIGPEWLKEASQLSRLKPYADDQEFRRQFAAIKRRNKEKLAHYIKQHYGIEVDVNSIFDVQAKRLHEYKRQHLNALHILYLYDLLLQNPEMDFVPRTFIFAAKAAPGYARAKQIIKLINSIAQLVNNDVRINNKIKVVFLENYSVTLAQLITVAADLSEQISTAGKEASGTGNMKFMLNGALTIGTLDGANVEMLEQAGEENIFIFGLRANEVADRYVLDRNDVQQIYSNNYMLHKVLDHLIDGSLGGQFTDVYQSLLFGDYGLADPYMVLRDFEAYVSIQQKVAREYTNADLWWKKAVLNTAAAGYFSSDRTILEYNEKVWHL